MNPKTSFCLQHCRCTKTAEKCASLDFASKEIAENAPEGTPLFEIPLTGNEIWEYKLGPTERVDGKPLLKLQGYLKLLRSADKYEMVLNQPLDIESIYDSFRLILTALVLKLTCKLSYTSDLKTVEVFLVIKPINEFAPKFAENLKLNVPEDSKVGSEVFSRLPATDKDVNPSGRELARFQLWKYIPAAALDGIDYFAISDPQQGSLELQKAVDYETLHPAGATMLYLNVSASDVHGITTFAVLTVQVDNVDDLPPEFYHPGCPQYISLSKPCVVAFEAEVFVNYQGPLNRLFPGRVQARDMDRLNVPIVYNLEETPGRGTEDFENFSINKTTGQIDIVSPFSHPQIIRLVLVREPVLHPCHDRAAAVVLLAFSF
ncbi:hypothetical protein RRG08_030544 [Elysia crispata]|uniref:Cadherin domain-containing protein n=1 Tax=Elysia crispata TaxID=231223 RepID=A0AAE0YH75_9GAST|nr:hypothetical protein RRG08_030544 [Elysia crispata]